MKEKKVPRLLPPCAHPNTGKSKGYLLRLGFDVRVFRVLPMVDALMSGWQIPLANLCPPSQTKTRKTTIYTIYTKSNARYTKKH